MWLEKTEKTRGDKRGEEEMEGGKRGGDGGKEVKRESYEEGIHEIGRHQT